MENLTLNQILPAPLKSVLPYARCMMVAIAVTMLFGAGLSQYFSGMEMLAGAGKMMLIAGTGWAVTALLALGILGARRFDYIHAMGDVKQTGIMAILPVTVLLLVAGPVHVLFPVLSVVLSSGLMLTKHIRLMRTIQVPAWWTIIWFASLQVTAGLWVAFFFLF